jgi:alpha-galactosidase
VFKTLMAAVLLVASLPAIAQKSGVHFDASTKVFRLDGGDSSYVFGVNSRGELEQVYWGGRLGAADKIPQAQPKPEHASFDGSYGNTPQEYVGWGAGLFNEPALKITFADGNRDLVLHYDSHAETANGLDVVLKDISRPIFVTLHYAMDLDSGILSRSATIENRGADPVTVEQAAAAAWALPAGKYTLNYLTGRWAGEWTLTQEPVHPGARVIESRRGTTGHQANPWFALQSGAANEDHGEVWFGALGWSGSWRFTIEQDQLDAVRVTGGYNPFDFGYVLKPGEKLETPIFYGGYAANGLGGASRLLHAYELRHILPRTQATADQPLPKPRPVIYNSWEATEFRVNEAGQMALAEKAAALGIDRFVMDDGWFGQRKVDNAGLGDWYVNKDKFPNGLKPLIDKVHALGMDFGLWVEPEMVNPDSDLYRAHPDWVLHFPTRPESQERNQLVLNLARPDVRDYVFGFLDKLLSENQIAFLKWDYNRNWSEPGWPEAPGNTPGHVDIDAQKEIYVRYVQNLYAILAELRAKHPKLEIESCSGGGGRVDLGILRYTDEVWPSDNTDALDRLSVQDGFTHAYTPETMAAWVTDVPNFLDRRSVPLQFRFLVAMQGALGIGSNLTKFTADDMALATRLTSFYKGIRTTVQHGELYRLEAPEHNETSQVEYVAQDGSQAVVFAYLHSQQYGLPQPAVTLEGLDPRAMYSVTALDGSKYMGEAEVSGALLMGGGVHFNLVGDYDATAIVLKRQ